MEDKPPIFAPSPPFPGIQRLRISGNPLVAPTPSGEGSALKRVWLGHIPCIAGVLLMGWWNETRIFGELTALAAVTAAIEFEQFIRIQFHPSACDEPVSENVFALTAE